MNSSTMQMHLGENLGTLLLDIAQTNVMNGEIDKVFETYIKSFPGFNKEHVISVLKNKAVIVVNDTADGIILTDDAEIIKNNDRNIWDWNTIIMNNWHDVAEIEAYINELKNDFEKTANSTICDFNIFEYGRKHNMTDISHIVAKILADKEFSNKRSSGEQLWIELVDKVSNGIATNAEYNFYFIVEYVNAIKKLNSYLIKFCNAYKFLNDNEMCERHKYIADKVENVFSLIDEFLDMSQGYYHPMCNVEIYELKNTLYDDLLKTDWGKEYFRYGILQKNIDDEYDACWLGPDGEFYGYCGPESGLMHLRMAEQIYECTANPISGKMHDDSVSCYSSNSPERWLEKHGWIKIHGNEVYGTFMDDLDGYLSEPNEKQIEIICKYINNHHNGKLFTQPQIVHETECISTYKLRQMDKYALRDVFQI